ncbi:hypothetical protein ECFRIK1997_3359, partial [Escherichia coli FRIK1997]
MPAVRTGLISVAAGEQ